MPSGRWPGFGRALPAGKGLRTGRRRRRRTALATGRYVPTPWPAPPAGRLLPPAAYGIAWFPDHSVRPAPLMPSGRWPGFGRALPAGKGLRTARPHRQRTPLAAGRYAPAPWLAVFWPGWFRGAQSTQWLRNVQRHRNPAPTQRLRPIAGSLPSATHWRLPGPAGCSAGWKHQCRTQSGADAWSAAAGDPSHRWAQAQRPATAGKDRYVPSQHPPRGTALRHAILWARALAQNRLRP